MNKIYHHIYISIHRKYQNLILPKLPDYIVSYLLKNPQKLSYYLNPKITVENLLKHLIPTQPLLPQIITYMEAPYESK